MRCDLVDKTCKSRISRFNPHTYMRCDHLLQLVRWEANRFNPHTYMRCDAERLFQIGKSFRVSIHTPTWGVTVQALSLKRDELVSIHTPTWGVTRCTLQYERIQQGFNPHTYMRCDMASACISDWTAWFQSTHLHEVWHISGCSSLTTQSFNPHTYMRCDIPNKYYPFMGIVSIHTPTWGVTLFACCVISTRMFQSTHLHEVWRRHTTIGNSTGWFQSTHLHEVWLAVRVSYSLMSRFQSTHLHEVWLCQPFEDLHHLCVSIHTPTWGVTRNCYSHCVNIVSFNPHTYMRCDREQEQRVCWRRFQSTHLHEVWQRFSFYLFRLFCFNPHTYMRCDRDTCLS